LGFGAAPSNESARPSFSVLRNDDVPIERKSETTHVAGPRTGDVSRWNEMTGESMRHVKTFIAASVIAAATTLAAAAADISGAGATFPYPLYAKWPDAYNNETGVGLNYQSIGSGGGTK